jgi:hypothetical protein
MCKVELPRWALYYSRLTKTKMSNVTTPMYNNINFYQLFTDIGGLEPYAILSSQLVTFMTNRFDIWAQMIVTYPKLAAMCEESKSIHLDIVTNWQTAIGKGILDAVSPFVVIPEKQYKAAMLLLHVTWRSIFIKLLSKKTRAGNKIAPHNLPFL